MKIKNNNPVFVVFTKTMSGGLLPHFCLRLRQLAHLKRLNRLVNKLAQVDLFTSLITEFLYY